ncbi:helix-turn-helix transcriptional regulator [Allostreptomyces psammosilenae]|uniref:Transcriptional regulator with XRE-family HTH domain n=1 Tax=Allostreptomyces psammosilenae TaxID=1892865 RepID=A0A852ZZT5_9ACTN|nr:helix-turn-helix transcriptional regulator [Allostreptomyces psammosilenae]NYI07659.1 transcriptional regulator with XRE-family HTH domain [Allostreptomyces psammosilenae]
MADTDRESTLWTLRKARGWTQQDLVDQFQETAARLGRPIGISLRTVSRWESGNPPWPNVEAQRVLEKLFCLPISQLGFVATGDTVSPSVPAKAEQSDVGPATMDSLHQAVDQLCREYPSAASDTLHQQARGWLNYTTRLLHGRTTLAEHRELLVIVGWLFLLCGCLEHDMGQRRTAELSRAAAARIGAETGHGEITAWSWEMAAWFALTQERYGDALAAAQAGRRPASGHSVAVQLLAQEAKAHARMGSPIDVRKALDHGRGLLDRLPRPAHPEHHFVIDPDKWDFYEMDAYRLLGDDARAGAHAAEVIRLGTRADGTTRSPMRVAEARLTLGVGSARSGELEEAVDNGMAAFEPARKSLPSLLLVGSELDAELQARYPREVATRDYREHLRALATVARRALEA